MKAKRLAVTLTMELLHFAIVDVMIIALLLYMGEILIGSVIDGY